MSNPSAIARALTGIALVAVSISRSGAALGDTKQECSEAFDNTQVLRDAGNIEAALVEATKCIHSSCAEFIRDDCAKWKEDLEGRQSTVLIEIVDALGARVTEGSVSLDGAPWLDRLDDRPRALAKGPHTLVITVKGAAPHTKSLVVREGEKGRKLSFSLGEGEPGPDGPTYAIVDPEEPPAPKPARGLVVPAIVTGAGGLALAVTGGILLGLAADHAATITDLCGASPPECSGSTADREEANKLGESGKQLEIAGGTLAAIGAAGVAIGATMLFVDAGRRTSKDAARAAFMPGVWLAPNEGGVWLRGSF
jgi:hypothetical protein